MSQNPTSENKAYPGYVSSFQGRNPILPLRRPPSLHFSDNPSLQGSGMSTDQAELGPQAPQLQVKSQFEVFAHFLAWNNSVMFNLVQKNSLLQDNIKFLREQLDRLKKTMQTELKPKIIKPFCLDTSHKGDLFLSNKFGERTYKYSLAAIKSIPKQLYKERNFNMSFKLVDSERNLIINCNPIPVSLCLYESDSLSSPIQFNKSGKPIAKGNCESILYHGKCEFRKIHIREVTSYYPNGWIYAVIYPKQPSFNYTYKDSTVEIMVDYQEVKPLVVTNVVVRAKKK